jgi:guanosine-3',5'-bis(diphosphate) 3'-pyrophosphohydrolase
LPKGSTPLDFAYRVHTELGHRCIGAKVNGRLVPLNYQLKNGDVVEIMSAKGEKGPSYDWLSPQLGYIKTSRAREKIRQWFKKRERTENIERGRQILDKELKRLGITIEREKLAGLFNYTNLDDFLAAIGYGGITTHQIVVKLAAQQEPPKVEVEVTRPKPVPSAVQVLGVGNLVTHLAQCCHPVPGDRVIGYITRSRGVTIHRQDCYNVLHEDEKQRLVPVEWGKTDSLYPVRIQVEAWDRVGLMRDITTIVAEEKVNIASFSLTNHHDHTISLDFIMETEGLAQLSRLMRKIEAVKSVLNIARIGDAAAPKGGDKT